MVHKMVTLQRPWSFLGAPTRLQTLHPVRWGEDVVTSVHGGGIDVADLLADEKDVAKLNGGGVISLAYTNEMKLWIKLSS